MADDADVAALLALHEVHEITGLALEAIDTDKTEQKLRVDARGYPFYGPHALSVVQFLQGHPNAVNRLNMSFGALSQHAVEILRAYFTTATLGSIVLHGRLGIANGTRLLSGLHHNTSVTELDLEEVGFEGMAGGSVIASLMRHNSTVSDISLYGVTLGPEGALAMRDSLRENQAIDTLCLTGCLLRDDGVSTILNALPRTPIKRIEFGDNCITSNSLPVITQLLHNESSLEGLILEWNPGLFDNVENTKNFSNALKHHENLLFLSLDECQLPSHAVIALFRAVAARNKLLFSLEAYDSDQLQGQDLDNLLEIIPQLQHLEQLKVNLDFSHPSVVAAFHRNSSIKHVFFRNDDDNKEEISGGPIFGSLERNRRLPLANSLIEDENAILQDLHDYESDCESGLVHDYEDGRLSRLAANENKHVPLGGLVWSKGIARLGRDAFGATAVYKIMCDRLPLWWRTSSKSATTNATINATAPALSAAAAVHVDDRLPPAPSATTIAAAAAAAPMSSGTTEEATQETTSSQELENHDKGETTATDATSNSASTNNGDEKDSNHDDATAAADQQRPRLPAENNMDSKPRARNHPHLQEADGPLNKKAKKDL